MILLDTNIILYSLTPRSPKHKIAQKYIVAHIDELVIAPQNINEALRVLTHPKYVSPMTASHAVRALGEFSDACYLLCPNQQTTHIHYELLQKHNISGNHIFDAYLVATMMTHGVSAIATDNVKDFRIFTDLTIHNPVA